MSVIANKFLSVITRAIRKHLVGSDQRWLFEPIPKYWTPPIVESTSMYLHVPFCKSCCPYCPYTKVPYDEILVSPYTQAALAEVNWWFDKIGSAEITSIYIGGGTPTLVMDSIKSVLLRIRKRFNLSGEICIETNPADVNDLTIRQMHEAGVTMVSLGIQSFNQKNLDLLGRKYVSSVAESSLALLANSSFTSINADIMFALPDQTVSDLIEDLDQAASIGANQITTYPLFTFPYTSVGKYLHLKSVRMPDLHIRRAQYLAISKWCRENGFERVSVWGFKKGNVPRYSSVTRDSYIGIGPGAGSYLSDGFVINTFNLQSWIQAIKDGKSAIALRMPFTDSMNFWWWLYWRLYDTYIPLENFNSATGRPEIKARRLMRFMERAKLAIRNGKGLELTELGAFWLHLAQNQFSLNYVNTIWTESSRVPWPKKISL